ncbi:MAG: rod shape-determining protein RodA [Flavobacteriaceae bacterium]|nr:MAG: rod shape-determining protein RodA [Flavobacteriaceae bacterium]
MRKRKSNIFKGVDWVLIAMYLLFVFLGWLSIYEATFSETEFEVFDFSTKYGKQMIWILLSFIIVIVILAIDKKFYEQFSGIFYLASILTLVGLFVFGNNINGATSWYSFGSFGIQPSEFAKAATALALANYLDERNQDLKKLNNQLKAFGIIFLPALLITFQPDPGSALVYGSLILVLYQFGLPLYYLVIGFLALLLFVVTLYFGFLNTLLIASVIISGLLIYLVYKNKKYLRHNWLRFVAIYLFTGFFIVSVDYVFNNVFDQRHRDRFNILLGKDVDDQGIGYNTAQSVITIGSGGITGKGFLQGDRTQGDFVPEQQTDYIFSTIGEEWGFLGSSFVIILFIAFLIRLLFIADRQKSMFSKVFSYATVAIFFFHFTINIGMVIGLLPTIGIPLPFFSYGGSSLWGFTLLLFIMIRLDADRIYEW